MFGIFAAVPVADGVDVSHVKGLTTTPDTTSDTTAYKDNNDTPAHRPNAHVTTLAVRSTSSSEADSDIAAPSPVQLAHSKDAAAVGAFGGLPAVPAAATEGAGPSGLCPVVAFASFAAQLSFKAILHLVVFGGRLWT